MFFWLGVIVVYFKMNKFILLLNFLRLVNDKRDIYFFVCMVVCICIKYDYLMYMYMWFVKCLFDFWVMNYWDI